MSDTYSEKQTNIYCALLTGNQHSQSEPKDTKTREDNLMLQKETDVLDFLSASSIQRIETPKTFSIEQT